MATLNGDNVKRPWRSFGTPPLIIIVVVAAYLYFAQNRTVQQEVSLSTVVQEINNNAVKQVTVDGNKLTIVRKDGPDQIAQKEEESSLTQSLTNYGVEKEKLAAVDVQVKDLSGSRFWFGTILPFVIPFVLIGAFVWFMLGRVQSGNKKAMNFGQTNARQIVPTRQKVTFKDVAGSDEAKEELKEIVEFLRHPNRFLAVGAKIPKGVLMVGAPGTGKTLLAQALAGEAKVPYFHVSGSEFVEMFVGVGASRVRDLFKKAKKHAPAILFIDEIDAVGRQRGSGLGGSHDEREQTLNQILVEMDGFESHTNVIVIAATNRPDVLDPALLRPGRFDRRVMLDLPDIKAREAILKVHARKKPLGDDVKLITIAQRTPGFSGADLANILNEAAIMAAQQQSKKISMKNCLDAMEKVMLGPERKSRVITKKDREVTAYHEGGHAIVAYTLPDSDPVQKVSIISRGRAAGYTLKAAMEDRHMQSRREFIADLAVMVAGHTAEKIIFNDITTGATNDLQNATELARRMVTEFGMSDKMGPRTYGSRDEMVFLGKDIAEQRNYSEQTAREIDEEVSRLIDEAFKTATKIITENRAKIDLLAKTLLEREVLEREEFEALLSGKALPKSDDHTTPGAASGVDAKENVETGKIVQPGLEPQGA